MIPEKTSLSYFNPFSKAHHALKDLKTLNPAKQILVCLVAGLAGIFSGFILMAPVFRALVGRISPQLPNNQPLEITNSIKNKSNEILLKKAVPLSAERITELSNVEQFRKNPKGIINTGMTNLLVPLAFSLEESKLTAQQALSKQREFNGLIVKLVEAAKSNREAYVALTRSNNPESVSEDKGASGFPQNNPLTLLVKAGNREGVQAILPAYQAKDLLFVTPRGNSVLHIALITGQLGVAMDIMRRAEQLGVLEKLVEMPNYAGKTVQDILASLFSQENQFDNFQELASKLLGGEEIGKAAVTDRDYIDLEDQPQLDTQHSDSEVTPLLREKDPIFRENISDGKIKTKFQLRTRLKGEYYKLGIQKPATTLLEIYRAAKKV